MLRSDSLQKLWCVQQRTRAVNRRSPIIGPSIIAVSALLFPLNATAICLDEMETFSAEHATFECSGPQHIPGTPEDHSPATWKGVVPEADRQEFCNLDAIARSKTCPLGPGSECCHDLIAVYRNECLRPAVAAGGTPASCSPGQAHPASPPAQAPSANPPTQAQCDHMFTVRDLSCIGRAKQRPIASSTASDDASDNAEAEATCRSDAAKLHDQCLAEARN
jgi:hypothetical protein